MPKNLLNDHIIEFLSTVQPESISWPAILHQLERFISEQMQNESPARQIKALAAATDHLIKTFSTHISDFQQIEIQLKLALRCETFGDWTNALKRLQKVCELSDKTGPGQPKAVALRWIGHIYAMQNKWQPSLKAFNQSLQLCKVHGYNEDEGQALSGIGILYFELGDLERALAYLDGAREIAEQGNFLALSAQVSNNIGALHHSRGEYPEALAAHHYSISVFTRIGDKRGLAQTYLNIAMNYASVKNWPKAGENFERGYALSRELMDLQLQANIAINRVEICLAVHDLPLAEGLCEYATDVYEALNDRLGEAEVCKYLGRIYTEQGNWKAATAALKTGLRHAVKFKHPRGEAELHIVYGQMFAARGDFRRAIKEHQAATKCYDSSGATQLAELQIQVIERLRRDAGL